MNVRGYKGYYMEEVTSLSAVLSVVNDCGSTAGGYENSCRKTQPGALSIPREVGHLANRNRSSRLGAGKFVQCVCRTPNPG